MFHISIFDSFYNEKMIKYLGSLDGEVVLANCYISGPERDFIDYYCFLGIFVNGWN